MALEIVNIQALKQAISAHIENALGTVSLDVTPLVSFKRLEKVLLASVRETGLDRNASFSILMPCRQRKGLPEWAVATRAKGGKLLKYDPRKAETLQTMATELVNEILILVQFARCEVEGIARPARKFLKGPSLACGMKRCSMIHALEHSELKVEVRARMDEAVVVPMPIEVAGFRFVAMATPSEICALGEEAKNCLRRKSNEGIHFLNYAKALLDRKADFWAIRYGPSLIGVIETDLEDSRIVQVKGMGNIPPPAFLTEALYGFMLATQLRASCNDLGIAGVIDALRDKDRSRPDHIVWVGLKPYRIWLSDENMVIAGPRKHRVLIKGRNKPLGHGPHGTFGYNLSNGRTIAIFRALSDSLAGKHPVVEALAPLMLGQE